jgi:hypothetical protein
MNETNTDPFENVSSEWLIENAGRIAELEHEDPDFLIRVKAAMDDEGYLHVNPDDHGRLRAYRWLSSLGRGDYTLGKSKLTKEAFLLLEQVVEVRVVLHVPVPDNHPLCSRLLQALKLKGAHERGVLQTNPDP